MCEVFLCKRNFKNKVMNELKVASKYANICMLFNIVQKIFF